MFIKRFVFVSVLMVLATSTHSADYFNSSTKSWIIVGKGGLNGTRRVCDMIHKGYPFVLSRDIETNSVSLFTPVLDNLRGKMNIQFMRGGEEVSAIFDKPSSDGFRMTAKEMLWQMEGSDHIVIRSENSQIQKSFKIGDFQKAELVLGKCLQASSVKASDAYDSEPGSNEAE